MRGSVRPAARNPSCREPLHVHPAATTRRR